MRIRGERTRVASAVSTDRRGSGWARPVSAPSFRVGVAGMPSARRTAADRGSGTL